MSLVNLNMRCSECLRKDHDPYNIALYYHQESNLLLCNKHADLMQVQEFERTPLDEIKAKNIFDSLSMTTNTLLQDLRDMNTFTESGDLLSRVKTFKA